MTANDIRVEDYLRPPCNTFWQWQDSGEVIAWADGRTIAFRRELALVVKRLRAQPLPPLGTIVLLLAACRDHWHEPPSRLGLLAGVAEFFGNKEALEFVRKVGPELDRIGSFDRNLLSSPRAKAELVAMVLEHGPRLINAVPVEQICDILEHGIPESSLRPRTPPAQLDLNLQFGLSILARGLPRIDQESLELRLKTGLETAVLPATVELPEVQSARGLIAELADHAELGGVARLAQRLLGIVHLPAPLSQPEELPLGGVSDISNRGALDRLLVTELAQDNLTLAARVANNEALYLRRETPPRMPTRRRLVLLDAGLRMWGVPRVFATAIGLALAAQAGKRLGVNVYRASGSELDPVEMTTIAGLNAHLAALDHRVHPGAALPALAKLYDQAGEAADLVLVTGEDAAADRDFQRQLGEAGLPEVYLATVGRDGQFELLLQTRAGRKRLHAATLDLADLLRPSPRPSVPLVDKRASDLPAIFAADPFPLRLAVPVDAERSWHVRDFGALTYARDGRLLHWEGTSRGARQLAEGLPRGRLHCATSRLRDGRIYAVIGGASNGPLYSLIIDTREGAHALQPPILLDGPTANRRPLFMRGEAAIILAGAELVVCNLLTGARAAASRIAPLLHMEGAFFTQRLGMHGSRQWFLASFDGLQIRWEPVYTEDASHERLIAMLEVAGQEGPVGVTTSGRLYSVERDHYRLGHYPEAHKFISCDGVSRDGHWILLTTETPLGQHQAVLDVKSLAMHDCPDARAAEAMLEPALFAAAKPATLRHRFRGIGIDAQQRLVLIGRHETCWPLTFDGADASLRLPFAPEPVEPREVYAFELLRPRHRYELAAATFGDGSVAVLDSRGLLHLKSSDTRLPEFSIVLAEGRTAGWIAGGESWGPEYFVGRHRKKRVSSFYEAVLRPFLEHAR